MGGKNEDTLSLFQERMNGVDTLAPLVEYPIKIDGVIQSSDAWF